MKDILGIYEKIENLVYNEGMDNQIKHENLSDEERARLLNYFKRSENTGKADLDAKIEEMKDGTVLEAGQVVIYEGDEQSIQFNLDDGAETIWATQVQIAEVFNVTVASISTHLKNIYREGELEEKRTIKESLIVRNEGTRQVKRRVKYYNLDAIISVGYRVNSRKATNFRIWASSVLKHYITDGVVVNRRRLEQLSEQKLAEIEGALGVVKRLMVRSELSGDEANGILEVIARYSSSFRTLKEFDDGYIRFSSGKAVGRRLTIQEAENYIVELRNMVNGGQLFGKPRAAGALEAVNTIYQSFDGEEVYPSVAEKAANLLYFIIKDHPFYDGNKRIGALLFIVFLTLNDYHLADNGETKISDRALTALALLIAESEPSEKGLIIALVCKLLE